MIYDKTNIKYKAETDSIERQQKIQYLQTTVSLNMIQKQRK